MHTFHYKYDKQYYKLLPKPKACSASKNYLHNMITDKNAIFLVVEEKKLLIGCLLAHVENRPPVLPPQKHIILDHVVVSEQYQGNGVFSKLQRKLDKIAVERGASYIELIVDALNPVVKIYEKKGYSTNHLKMVKNIK